jgi:cell division septum initiation protein DivIVA
MRTFPHMDGDQLIELVEKREYDLLAQERADFGALVDKLERELNAAKELIESLEDALIEIEACCYEDDSENAAADASWHVARKAIRKLKEQSL